MPDEHVAYQDKMAASEYAKKLLLSDLLYVCENTYLTHTLVCLLENAACQPKYHPCMHLRFSNAIELNTHAQVSDHPNGPCTGFQGRVNESFTPGSSLRFLLLLVLQLFS